MLICSRLSSLPMRFRGLGRASVWLVLADQSDHLLYRKSRGDKRRVAGCYRVKMSAGPLCVYSDRIGYSIVAEFVHFRWRFRYTYTHCIQFAFVCIYCTYELLQRWQVWTFVGCQGYAI